MTLHTFKKLETIQKLISEKAYEKAEKKLKNALKKLPSAKEDQAYIFHTAGMYYLQQEDYTTADTWLLKAWELKVLPESTQLYLMQTLAGLRMQAEKYTEAIPFYEAWIEQVEAPPEGIYLGLGAAYFYTDRYDDTVSLMNTALNKFPKKEALWQLLLASYYEVNDLSKAAKTLARMLRHWPNKQKYWQQLASIHLELGAHEDCLEIMQAGIANSTLSGDTAIRQYVYTLYEKHLPYKAAVVLEHAIETGIAEKNRENYELLSSMYQEGRDREKAIRALKQASNFSEDGRHDLNIAQLYFEQDGKLKQVITYAKRAIEKGVKQEGNAHMLIAVAYAELNQPDAARPHLKAAAEFKETRKSANQWLQSLEE
ncbi:MAG: hypothetical protein CSA22_03575 [Deltaproteobacteria bacterium]|nr:MAG: hypothetical protein CSA22_03575 [Deltaproteobacteria bacterium]